LNEAMQKGKRLRKQLKNKKDCDDENLLWSDWLEPLEHIQFLYG
jgi:hypothetical protein